MQEISEFIGACQGKCGVNFKPQICMGIGSNTTIPPHQKQLSGDRVFFKPGRGDLRFIGTAAARNFVMGWFRAHDLRALNTK